MSLFYIPMFGFTESFNISVSAALCMHELSTRIRSTVSDFGLSPDENWTFIATGFAKALARAKASLNHFKRQKVKLQCHRLQQAFGIKRINAVTLCNKVRYYDLLHKNQWLNRFFEKGCHFLCIATPKGFWGSSHIHYIGHCKRSLFQNKFRRVLFFECKLHCFFIFHCLLYPLNEWADGPKPA